jgi:hypothetical protein
MAKKLLGKYRRRLQFMTLSAFLLLVGVILGANLILAINNSPAIFNIAEALRVCIGPDGLPRRCPPEGDLSLISIMPVQAPFGQDKLVGGKPAVLALSISSSFPYPVDVLVRVEGSYTIGQIGGGAAYFMSINVRPGSNNAPIFVPPALDVSGEQMCFGAKLNPLAYTLAEMSYANNEINAGSPGTCYPIVSTRPLSVLYVPVVIDGDDTGAQLTSQEINDFRSTNDDYLKGSWPLAQGGYRSSLIGTLNISPTPNLFLELDRIRMEMGFDNVVGVVREGWMSQYGGRYQNSFCGGTTHSTLPTSIIEGKLTRACSADGLNSLLVAHEVAHTFDWVAFDYGGPNGCPDQLPARHFCVNGSGYWVARGIPMEGDDFMYPGGWCCDNYQDWISVHTFNYLIDRLRR